jgi:hypothetical protein
MSVFSLNALSAETRAEASLKFGISTINLPYLLNKSTVMTGKASGEVSINSVISHLEKKLERNFKEKPRKDKIIPPPQDLAGITGYRKRRAISGGGGLKN